MIKHDEIGPEKIIEVHDAKSGMHGFLVIDNTNLGPGKGGFRMTPSVSKEEVARLARAMTLKTAMAELPFGGAKGGVVANSKELTKEKKKEIVEAYANALKSVCPSLYVSAPDMNIGEEEMKWFADANGDLKSCTGKPKELGGIPHELGSTGFGVFHSAKTAIEHLGMNVKDISFVVEGFGNVGLFAAKYMTEAGAKLVGASDSRGLVYNKDGIDFKKLEEAKKKGSVLDYGGEARKSDEILDLEADVLITAAIPDLIKEKDIDRLKFKIIIEGSNIPMNEKVEEKLKNKILIVPDFVANAGGVISSYVEYAGLGEDKMFNLVKEKVVNNTKLVLEKAKEKRISPRKAAMKIARERVLGKGKV